MSNLIVYSEQASDSDVANLIYSCISNMDEEELVITDEEFNLNFNLYETKSSMNKLFEQYQKKVNLVVQANIEIIDSVESKSTEEKHEVSRTIIDKVKRELEELMQNYREEHASRMHSLDHDTLLAKMEKENATICNEFVDKVAPLMSSNLSNDKTSTNEGEDIIQSCKNFETRQDDQQEIDQSCNPKDKNGF
jgi:transketolase